MNLFSPKSSAFILLLAVLAVFVTVASIFFYQPQPARRPLVDSIAAAPAMLPPVKVCPADFGRDLKLGIIGDDVKALQRYLNNHGSALADNGVGSKGKETFFFGPLTRRALARFQVAKGIVADLGNFDIYTRDYLGCVFNRRPANETASNPTNNSKTEEAAANYYTVGGKVTGLDEPIVLQNNGKDDLTVNPGDSSIFAFHAALADGQPYMVIIKTKPANHTCYVNRGAGMISGANINSVEIACGKTLSFNPYASAPAPSKAVTYTLTYTAGSGGSITGSASQTVNNAGNGSAVTATADAHYSFVNWSDESTDNPRTDTNVTADKLVTANFTIDTYTITSSAEVGGTISPLGDTVKNYGSSQTYTITPDELFTILDVFVDSQSVGAVASYEFTDIAANHTINATFDGGAQ